MEIAVWKMMKALIRSLASSLTPFKIIEWQNGGSFQTARFWILVLNGPNRTKATKAEQECGSAHLSPNRLLDFTISMSNRTKYLEWTNGRKGLWGLGHKLTGCTGTELLNGLVLMERNVCSGTEMYWLQWDRKVCRVFGGTEKVNGLIIVVPRELMDWLKRDKLAK